MDDVADANDEIGSTKGAVDAGKLDARFEVILGFGRIKERVDIGVSRPQRFFDIVARERVVVDRRADEIVERAFALDQPAHRRMERRAAIGVAAGGFA